MKGISRPKPVRMQFVRCELRLSDNSIALVDDVDWDWACRFNWTHMTNGYVKATIGGKERLLHRLIAERAGLDLSVFIDHEDRNSLNNRRYNLRPATRSQNCANSKPRANGLPKGVKQHRNKFMADITVNRKTIYLGTFNTPEQAHEAYCEAATKYFGIFARAS